MFGHSTTSGTSFFPTRPLRFSSRVKPSDEERSSDEESFSSQDFFYHNKEDNEKKSSLPKKTLASRTREEKKPLFKKTLFSREILSVKSYGSIQQHPVEIIPNDTNDIFLRAIHWLNTPDPDPASGWSICRRSAFHLCRKGSEILAQVSACSYISSYSLKLINEMFYRKLSGYLLLAGVVPAIGCLMCLPNPPRSPFSGIRRREQVRGIEAPGGESLVAEMRRKKERLGTIDLAPQYLILGLALVFGELSPLGGGGDGNGDGVLMPTLLFFTGTIVSVLPFLAEAIADVKYSYEVCQSSYLALLTALPHGCQLVYVICMLLSVYHLTENEEFRDLFAIEMIIAIILKHVFSCCSFVSDEVEEATSSKHPSPLPQEPV